jgi:hypothetical protein
MDARASEMGTRNREPEQRHRPGRRSRWWIAAGTFLFAACGTGAPEDEEGRVTISSTAVHVVGTSEVIARVADLQPAADGRVWILNSTTPLFVVFGPDGQVEREFGRSGGGPAEFGFPAALVRGPDPNDVWTYDVTRHALIRLTADDRRDLRLPPDSLPRAQLVSFAGAGIQPARPWLESGSDGFLLARTRPGRAEPFSGLGFWSADIVRVLPDSSAPAIEVQTPVADLLGDPASRYPGATKFLPYPLWTVCADGRVILYDPLENELRRVAGNGAVPAPVMLPPERQLDFTFDRFFGMLYRRIRQDFPAAEVPDSAEVRRRFAAEFGEFESQSASVFPEYADLRCTGNGTLWLQPFDPASGGFGGRGPAWYRISMDGSRTLVNLPDEFTPFRFEADRIWGTVQDSLGVASIAWIGADALR